MRKTLKNSMKNAKKDTKGITLIALIVTIIVLIILAGVAIAMLRGDNGIINRATEVRTANEAGQFDEAVKLAFMSAKTKIDAKKSAETGYIATTEANTAEIATEVAKELGTTAKKAPQAEGAKIETEGYTVAYYLDVQGDAKTDGKTFIVIWYTNNSLRSTLNVEEAKTKYGLTEVWKANKSINQAVLVSVIQISNYNAELSGKGITSTTDGDSDLTKDCFGGTSLNNKLGFKGVKVVTPVAATAYGGKVTNYRYKADGVTPEDWEIFYQGAVEPGGESRIYLIRTDTIGSTDPTSTATTSKLQLKDKNNVDYGGSTDFNDSAKLSAKYPAVAQGLLWKTYQTKQIGEVGPGLKYTSANSNMQATQWLLDSTNWESYKDTDGYADYVIGGPTLELLAASYNKKQGTNEEIATPTGNGYAAILDSSGTLPSNTNGSNPWNHGSSYWLACPSSRSSFVRLVISGGSVGGGNYSNAYGLRPIVCLNSGFSLEAHTSGGVTTYTIE